jgi:hypothetical protein
MGAREKPGRLWAAVGKPFSGQRKKPARGGRLGLGGDKLTRPSAQRGKLRLVPASYWITRKMRFEFGPTITRWPSTKAVPLPSGLVKRGRSCEEGQIL